MSTRVFSAVSATLIVACGGASQTGAPQAQSSAAAATGPSAVSESEFAPAAAKASGASRTYCMWVDPATERVYATVVAMAYPRPYAMTKTSEGERVLTTAPKDGSALEIEQINLIGSTKLNVTAVPPSAAGDAAAKAFLDEFERKLKPPERCK